jgi:hypothetical protein
MIAECYGRRMRDSPRPWADPGWAAETGAWLAAEMDRLGRPVTGPPREVQAWEMACGLRPPVDPHLAQSTAWWLRRVLAGPAAGGS